MPHFLYVLHSKTADRYYVGESKNIENRLSQHNNHYFFGSFTKAANDWKVVLSKKCNVKEEALYLEKFIKRMKSKKFVQKVIEKPEILEELLNKR